VGSILGVSELCNSLRLSSNLLNSHVVAAKEFRGIMSVMLHHRYLDACLGNLGISLQEYRNKISGMTGIDNYQELRENLYGRIKSE
jgi:hypothetical protein